MRLTALLACLALPAAADPAGDVERTARSLWAKMPIIRTVSRIDGTCGADEGVTPAAAYCTSQNVILMTPEARADPAAAYRAAHVYGHAVQVQHGIADLALAAIRAEPQQETQLRGSVERQVECIAGVIAARAGHPQRLAALFSEEPFTAVHWGRAPLRIGPSVRITLAARDEWYARGLAAGEPSVCAVGEIPAGPVVAAFRE